MGIEPTYLAWKASVLPLNYTRKFILLRGNINQKNAIGVTGFEPATPWSQTRYSSQTEPHPDEQNASGFRNARLILTFGFHIVNTFFDKKREIIIVVKISLSDT